MRRRVLNRKILTMRDPDIMLAMNGQRNNSGTCETGSTSFNEGCDEYDSQEDAYDKCVAKRR